MWFVSKANVFTTVVLLKFVACKSYLYRLTLHVYISKIAFFNAEPYFNWVLVFVNFELMM